MTEERFPASDKQSRDARNRGEVPQSSDLTSTAAFIGALVGTTIGGHQLMRAIGALWDYAMSTVIAPDNVMSASQWLALAIDALLSTVGPVLMSTLLCAGLVSFLQVGALAAWKRIQPDFSRLDPTKGLERIFSLQSAVTLAKLILKGVLLGIVVFYSIRSALDAAVRLGRSHPLKVFDVASPLLLHVFGWACVVYLLVSAADFAFQRFDFLRKKRMSLDEVRREHRETQGDPHTTSRQRAIRMEALFSVLPDQVRMASAVVVGPGVSVALIYLGPEALPILIAKGRGEVAAQIRMLAGMYLVPIAHDPALAETMDSDIALGDPIARPHFKAVAKLLRWAAGTD